MARRALTMTTAAFTATAALLLTACGGSDESSPEDIKGAGGGSPSASASASGDTADVKRPDVSVPGDLKLVFDFEKPSDTDERRRWGMRRISSVR
ncbi:hypothetical protein [Streptomyces parvulus]|uniref:hypothetical protein n=1 Tax=Streptomyces parvulus TaxID=146923 RepID=UPI002690A6F3|nr:hypothetical protein [Streptomyces parvulus]